MKFDSNSKGLKRIAKVVALCSAMSVVPNILYAHHGWAAFNSGNSVTFKATVIDFHFVNPHSIIEFQFAEESGKLQTWEGELTSPSHLAPRGWSKTSLEPGDEITITGYPAKNGTHAMRVMRLLKADGTELRVGGGN